MAFDPLDDSRVPADAIGRVFTETRYAAEAFEFFDQLVDNPRTVNHAWGYPVIGPARCGKTTVVKEYLRICRLGEGGRKPLKVLWIQLAPDSRLPHIAQATLEQLGDPNPGYGSQEQKTTRASKAIVRGNYDLIVYDEGHHLVDTDTKRVQSKGAGWFSQLLDQASVPMLIIGYELFANVLADNQFLDGRLLLFPELRAYRHDDEDDLAEFAGVLGAIEEFIGLPAPSGLDGRDTAQRICVTCLGKLGLVERFLTSARNMARSRRYSALTRELLRDTADRAVRTWASSGFNPFDVPDLEAALRANGALAELGGAGKVAERTVRAGRRK